MTRPFERIRRVTDEVVFGVMEWTGLVLLLVGLGDLVGLEVVRMTSEEAWIAVVFGVLVTGALVPAHEWTHAETLRRLGYARPTTELRRAPFGPFYRSGEVSVPRARVHDLRRGEAVAVALAPLVVAVPFGLVVAWGVGVGTLEAVATVVGFVVLLLGPSPGDWGLVVRAVRGAPWDDRPRTDLHSAAEGVAFPMDRDLVLALVLGGVGLLLTGGNLEWNGYALAGIVAGAAWVYLRSRRRGERSDLEEAREAYVSGAIDLEEFERRADSILDEEAVRIKNTLEELHGVGPSTAAAVADRYATVDGVRLADLEELESIPNVGTDRARAIHEGLGGGTP